MPLELIILNTSEHGNSSSKEEKTKLDQRKKEVLLYEIEKRRSIIFANFSNTTTNATKQREWAIITEK